MFRIKQSICVLGLALLSTTAHAGTAHGPFGLGLIVGEPTGVSTIYNLDDSQSIDAGIGWSFTNSGKFHLHTDYLRHFHSIIDVDSGSVDMHYGLGARIKMEENNKKEDETYFGVRIPVGLDYNFENMPIDIFLEAALIVDLAPETRADFNAGIGGRWYF